VAKLSAVANARSNRKPGEVTATLGRMWDKIGAGGIVSGAIISGATGVEPATAEERAFLETHPDFAVRATGTHVGHGVEPQFAMNVALAAIAVQHGRLFATHDVTGFEHAAEGALTRAVVTGVGHWRGEGLALVEKID
jgi:3-oxoacyl-[acyl-carrier-protein] synthase II